jgi:hypothetical protein
VLRAKVGTEIQALAFSVFSNPYLLNIHALLRVFRIGHQRPPEPPLPSASFAASIGEILSPILFSKYHAKKPI